MWRLIKSGAPKDETAPGTLPTPLFDFLHVEIPVPPAVKRPGVRRSDQGKRKARTAGDVCGWGLRKSNGERERRVGFERWMGDGGVESIRVIAEGKEDGGIKTRYGGGGG